MIEFSFDVIRRLAEASLFLSMSGVLVAGLLPMFRCNSPKLQTVAWSLCLLQGCILGHFWIRVPAVNTNAHVAFMESRQEMPVVDQSIGRIETNGIGSLKSQSYEGFSAIAADDSLSGSMQMILWTTIKHYWAIPVLGLWLFGIVVIVTQWMADYVRFVRHTECHECDQVEWNQELKAALEDFRISGSIRLYVSSCTGPALCLWPWGYRIVVPSSLWIRLSKAERQSILYHELAHYRRADIWRSLLVNLVAMIHWFNPVAWLAVRRLERAAELACDDIVKRANAGWSTFYASALLRIGEPTSIATSLSAGASSSQLAERIRRILLHEAPTDKSWKRNALFVVLLGLLFVQLIRVDLVAQETPKTQVDKGPTEAALQPATSLAISDAEFEQATKLIREAGGFVRSFHPRDSKDHWVQIILEGVECSDQVVNAIRSLSMESPTHLHIREATNNRIGKIDNAQAPGLNNLTTSGMEILRDTRVVRLELNGGFVTDDVVRVLPELKFLETLALENASVTTDSLLAVSNCVNLKSFGLSRNKNLDLAAIRQLSRLQLLTDLSIGDTASADIIGAINQFPTIESLSLTLPDDSSGRAFCEISSIGSLKRLDLRGNGITESVLVRLGNDALNLEQLYVRKVQNLTPRGIESIARLPKLEVLTLEGTDVNDAGVISLKPLGGLRWLDLSDTKVTDRSLLVIGQMDKLRQLFLMNSNITDAGLERLRNLENLVDLNVQGTYVKTIPDWLRAKERLRVSFDQGDRAVPNKPHEAPETALHKAVEAFNQKALKNPIGKFEPPLTVEEVIAAIRSWDRGQHLIDDKTFAIFQSIADAQELPLSASINSTTGWQTADYYYSVWWIDLSVMTGENAGYIFRIRNRLISSRKLEK